jgi:hypothetical protein
MILGLVLWTRGSGGTTGTTNTAQSATGTMTQVNEGGQITIKATWQGKQAGPVFALEMETHAVDLDGYNLRELAVLRTHPGMSIQPSGWDAPAGGHHRSGTLSFPSTTASGGPVIGPMTRSIELVIRDVGGIPERIFTWRL